MQRRPETGTRQENYPGSGVDGAIPGPIMGASCGSVETHNLTIPRACHHALRVVKSSFAVVSEAVQ